MSSQFYDPTVAVNKALAMAKRPQTLSGKVVGLFDNTKDQSDIILEAIGEDLIAKHGVKSLVVKRGVHYCKPALPEVVEEMARKCDVVICALGG